MSDVFEVGQKVQYRGQEVEVSYGPLISPLGFTWFVVRRPDGKEETARSRNLTAILEPPKFAVGDRVTLTTRSGSLATVEYGPFDDRDTYVVKLVDEPVDPDDVRTFTALASVMRSAPAPVKVGDRVRVVKDDPDTRAGEFVGKVGKLKSDGGFFTPYRVEFGDGTGRHGDPENGFWWVSEVERVTDEDTYEHDGVMYDLKARYTDTEGDTWRFARVGSDVRGTFFSRDVRTYDDTLEYAVLAYGPFTRIND